MDGEAQALAWDATNKQWIPVQVTADGALIIVAA